MDQSTHWGTAGPGQPPQQHQPQPPGPQSRPGAVVGAVVTTILSGVFWGLLGIFQALLFIANSQANAAAGSLAFWNMILTGVFAWIAWGLWHYNPKALSWAKGTHLLNAGWAAWQAFHGVPLLLLVAPLHAIGVVFAYASRPHFADAPEQPQQPVSAARVALGIGAGVLLVVGLAALGASRSGSASPTATPAATTSPTPQPTADTPPAPGTAAPARRSGCDASVAINARLRDRGTGAEIAGRAVVTLRVFNGGEESVQVDGWAAEESDTGPPCYATFTYALHGSRHTARFKFWPDDPPRLATANDEAGSMADMVELTGLGGTWIPTQDQLAVATLTRLAHGMNSEDVYLDPTFQGGIIVRRQHCVPGNVDYSGPEASAAFRMLRRARITRLRCVADSPWTFDIPRRGRPSPPYLPEAGGGA